MPTQPPQSRASHLLPVREQAKHLLFEEGSLELGGGWGLDLPTLPGDVRSCRWRAPGCQAEAVAAWEQERHTQGQQESSLCP
jgi:hypothetical protein